MNKLEIKYFVPDKKREKNILLIVLAVSTLVILTLIVVFSQPSLPSQNIVNLPPVTQDNVFKSNRVEVSDSDSALAKSDINLLPEDELRINLTTDDNLTYAWELSRNFDRQVLNLVEVKFHSVKQNVALSKSYQEWRFEATKQGSTQLSFILLDLNQDRKILRSETFQVRAR